MLLDLLLSIGLYYLSYSYICLYIGYWWESQKERPLGRPRHKWVDNIKIDLREIGWDGMDWIDLAQDRDQ
jgi:hypothetical protein